MDYTEKEEKPNYLASVDNPIMSIKSSRARDTALVSRGPFTRLDIWTDYSALIICMQEICCASVVLINYLPDFIRTELRCHTMCAAMKWKWLEGKFDKHQDFYFNICIHYFMPILADASANVSGQSLCLYYLSYIYVAHMGQFIMVWPIFFRGDSLSKANSCKFVTKWAKVFKLIFSLTYSLLPPRLCFDKKWK